MPSRATLSINQPSPGTLPHAGGCPPRCIPAQCHLQLPVSGLFGPRVPGASLPSPLPLSRWSPITVPSLKSGIPTFLHPRGGSQLSGPYQVSPSSSAGVAAEPIYTHRGHKCPEHSGSAQSSDRSWASASRRNAFKNGTGSPAPLRPAPQLLGEQRCVFAGDPPPRGSVTHTETPLLTPCGEPQDADPGPCPHSLVES